MDDDLLRALGRHQRDDLDMPEEALAPDDPWHDAARPLDDAERDRMMDAVLAAVDGGEEPEAAASEAPANEAPAAAVASLERARARRSAVIAAVLGLAAVLALAFFGLRQLRREPGPEVAHLPEYATRQLRGGAAAQRGEPPRPDAALELSASDEIDWVVTPAAPVREPLEVALLAEPAAGEAILVPRVDAVTSESGVVRLRGRLDRFVALTPGSWTLSLLVGGRGALPRDLAEARGEAPRWRRASIRVTVGP